MFARRANGPLFRLEVRGEAYAPPAVGVLYVSPTPPRVELQGTMPALCFQKKRAPNRSMDREENHIPDGGLQERLPSMHGIDTFDHTQGAAGMMH